MYDFDGSQLIIFLGDEFEFYQAIVNKDNEKVLKLIESNTIDINAHDSFFPRVCVSRGNFDMLKILVRRGAKIPLTKVFK